MLTSQLTSVEEQQVVDEVMADMILRIMVKSHLKMKMMRMASTL